MKGSFLRAFLVLMIGFAIGCGGNGDPQVTDEECQASGKVVVGKDCLPKCKEGQGGECACGGGEVWEKCTEGNVCRGADVAGKCMAIADAPKCDDGEVVDALCICGGSECSLGKTCLANDCLDFCVEGESDCACGEGEHLEKCEDGKVCLDLGEGMACGTKEPSSTDCESGDIAQALGCTCADKECTAGELCLIEEGSNVGSCHEVCRLDAVTNATCKCADNSDNWHVCGEGGYCRRTAGCAEACKSQGNKWCLCGDESTYCDEGSVCARIVGDTMGCMPECGVRPEADACWCYYRDKTMTAICRDGNACTNENGCSCGGGKACVNGHSCRFDECKCGDKDACTGANRCVEGECRCGLQDEADWTNPGCTNGADCDPTTGGCKKAKDSTAILAYGSNVGDPTEWYSDADNKIRGVVCDEDHVGVRLCRGNETGAKVGWAECNGEHWRIMEECAADELCTEGLGCVKTCAAEADCGDRGSCTDVTANKYEFGDVYNGHGIVEGGISTMCTCKQSAGCRGSMKCVVDSADQLGRCEGERGSETDIVARISMNCRAGEVLLPVVGGKEVCTCGESMKSCYSFGHCKTLALHATNWPHDVGNMWLCGPKAGLDDRVAPEPYCYDGETIGKYGDFGFICQCDGKKACKWEGHCSADGCKGTADGAGCYESEWLDGGRNCLCGGIFGGETCKPGQICVSDNSSTGTCGSALWHGVNGPNGRPVTLSSQCGGPTFCGAGEHCMGTECKCGSNAACDFDANEACIWFSESERWGCDCIGPVC